MRSRFFLSLLCILPLAGCKKTNAPQSKTKQTQGYPVTVKDNRGLPITIKQRPKRIVVAGTPLYTQIIEDLKAQTRIVGVTDSPNNPPQFKKLENIGRPWPLNLEKVLILKPDLILGTMGPYRAKLQKISNIPVFTGGKSQGGIESLTQIEALVRTLDRMLYGHTKRSTNLLKKRRGKLESLRRRLPKHKTKTVAIVYLPKAQGSRLYIVSERSPAHELLTMAGGKNIFAKTRGFAANVELLIRRDPDVIITDPRYIKHFKEHRALKTLKAIKHNQVYGIQAASYTSSRYHLAFRKLVHVLYPKLSVQGAGTTQ